MSLTPQHAVRIAAPAATQTLSPVRKKFNALVKKLDAERVKLKRWHDELPTIRALAERELFPLIAAYDAHHRALLLLFDQAWSDQKLSKTEREKLSDLICKTGLDLMQRGGDDAIVKAIVDKHTALAFGPRDLAADEEFMRDIFRAATGIKLDADADLSSPHALFEAMYAKMDENAPLEEPRPARSSAQEARHQAEESKLKQSVRDIFRKLVSALHPDRETDPAERARKTGLMQRVNAAYAANDLLGLLELQLEIEQINQAVLDQLDEKRVKQYSKILTGQIEELQAEIMAMQAALAFEMGLDVDLRGGPQALLRDLHIEIDNMRSDVQDIEADLVNFGDVKKLKARLRRHRIDDAPGFDAPWL